MLHVFVTRAQESSPDAALGVDVLLLADRVSASKMSLYVNCGFVNVFSGRPQYLIYLSPDGF